MSFINYFFPRKIHFPDSKYNKNLTVIDYWSSATLISDDLIESGKVMTHVWKTALRRLIPNSFVPKSVLLLGLAGGSNATLIRNKYPQTKILGVDIDPVMLDIGKKYFGLSKIKNLTLVTADAYDFVNKFKGTTHYDLILLDCFLGHKIPKKLENQQFIKKLKKHSRFVLINHLYWRGHEKATERFIRQLSKDFFLVKTHTWTNAIISLV